LLFNNSSWEMLRAFQPESRFNNLDELNYATIADSLGGRGVRVRTRKELKEALEAAVRQTDCFQLIEIMLEHNQLSRTMSRFVDGITNMRNRQPVE
jgi:indolepyruvate decarboxylase